MRLSFTNLETCHEALGMQSGKITASQLTVSSMRNRAHGPDEARIRTENNGGAWCPRTSTQPSHEYIQVNLRQLHVITAIETQGRHGGSAREFVDYYRIEYTRDPINDAGNESEWIKYKNRDEIEVRIVSDTGPVVWVIIWVNSQWYISTS
jgi:discoidin domain receptor family protein 2